MVTEQPWLNWSKQHQWESIAKGCDDPSERVEVKCRKCGQTRKVSRVAAAKLITRADPGMGGVWGCARVPLWFRLQCWFWDAPIPAWEVDSRPPWLADKKETA